MIRLSKLIKLTGSNYLEAPLSGGEHRSVSGNIAVLVSGERACFKRAFPILKEIGYEHWWDNGTPGYEGLDIYGFTALPSGSRSNDVGYYGNMGYDGCFWSSTEGSSNDAWYRLLPYDTSNVYRDNYYEKIGFSIRCLGD
mgnify:CR=1 FL=1